MRGFISFLLIVSVLFFQASAFSEDAFEQIYENELRKDIPEMVVKLTMRGKMKGKWQKFDSAINDFKAALKIKNDYFWAVFYLALAYTINFDNYNDIAENRFLEAERISKKHNIKSPLLHDMFGQFYIMKGEYEKALNQCNKALELDGKYARSYNNRGVVYEILGRNEEALVDYRIAMSMEVPKAKVNYKRVLQLIEKEREEEMERLLPETYFVTDRDGDPTAPPDTYFDNYGGTGMPPK